MSYGSNLLHSNEVVAPKHTPGLQPLSASPTNKSKARAMEEMESLVGPTTVSQTTPTVSTSVLFVLGVGEVLLWSHRPGSGNHILHHLQHSLHQITLHAMCAHPRVLVSFEEKLQNENQVLKQGTSQCHFRGLVFGWRGTSMLPSFGSSDSNGPTTST
eukprot:2840774-Amphidinium_carterae.1